MTPVAVAPELELGTLPLWPSTGSAPEPAPVRDPHRAPASTLAAALASTWATLEAGFTSACLLCGGTVHPRWSAGAGVVGGRCERCGTEVD